MNVKLREGLERIGERTFCECRSLVSIIIVPSTVKEISADAFYCCNQFDCGIEGGGLESND